MTITDTRPRGNCPDCGRPITLQLSGWWTHDGMSDGCWRSSMDGPSDSTDTDRAELIAQAREIDAEQYDSETAYDGPGRLDGASDRELTIALDILAGISAYDDMAGEIESTGVAQRFGRFILWTDNYGFIDAETFSSEGNAEASIARVELECLTREDEDATLSPCGKLGALTLATFGHEVLGEFASDDEHTGEEYAERAIADAMRASHFWPNVWRISDHGNELCISERFYSEHKEEIGQ